MLEEVCVTLVIATCSCDEEFNCQFSLFEMLIFFNIEFVLLYVCIYATVTPVCAFVEWCYILIVILNGTLLNRM